MADDARPIIGMTLQDTYRIEREVGKGGMGAVYEASHLRLRRRFAIKLLAPAILGDKEALARFRHEGEITSELGHPNIVEVIDFNFTPEGDPYIVMELLVGESLDERILRTPQMELYQINNILRQVASALSAAHDSGIIHRDLKPQNIFLCRHGDQVDFIKVLDFGISKVLGSTSVMTGFHTLMGSPNYMSPEQAEGRASEADHRADIFAMGSILYEMVAGRAPFKGDSLPAILYQVVHQEPPSVSTLRPGLPAGIERVLATAMAKEPDRRFSSMTRLAQEFAGALASPDSTWVAPAAQPIPGQRAEDAPHTLRTVPGISVPVIATAPGMADEFDSALAPTDPTRTLDRETRDSINAAAGSVAGTPAPGDPSLVMPAPGIVQGDLAPTPTAPPASTTPGPRSVPPTAPVPSVGNTSTLSASTGEMLGVARSRGRLGLFLGAGAIVMFLGAGAVFLALRDTDASEGPSPGVKKDHPAGTGVEAKAGPTGPAGSTLDTAPRSRSLSISSRPTGARVTLDRRPLGKTPLNVEVPRAAAELQVSKSGHERWTRKLEPGTKKIIVTARLKKLRGAPKVETPRPPVKQPVKPPVRPVVKPPVRPHPARVLASTGPGKISVVTRMNGKSVWANTFLDGKSVGQSPLLLKDLPAGRYRIDIRRPGYRSASVQITVRSGKKTRVKLSLIKE